MDWILDNLQLVIFIAGAIAYWLNQTRKGWAESGEEDVRETRQPHAPLQPRTEEDNADQVRRVQAEIRRKIAERRAAAGGPPPFADEPEPLYREPAPAYEPPPVPEAPPPLYSRNDDTASLDRQRHLAEQLAEAERAKAAARVKLAEIWDRPSVAAAKRSAARRSDGVNTPREILRDRRALRTAWIMREVLEKPVALR
ncbi:MAG: hypothetical protein ABII82_10490 [Verrucomicrobiota bacterium]